MPDQRTKARVTNNTIFFVLLKLDQPDNNSASEFTPRWALLRRSGTYNRSVMILILSIKKRRMFFLSSFYIIICRFPSRKCFHWYGDLSFLCCHQSICRRSCTRGSDGSLGWSAFIINAYWTFGRTGRNGCNHRRRRLNSRILSEFPCCNCGLPFFAFPVRGQRSG